MANNGRFQKGNWSRLAGDPKAVVYLPGGIATQTLSAQATTVITANVPFQFKGNGPVEASFPFGQSFQNSTGQPSLSETWLTEGTSYASGVHPVVNIRLANSSTASAAITAASDLLVTQF